MVSLAGNQSSGERADSNDSSVRAPLCITFLYIRTGGFKILIEAPVWFLGKKF